MRCGRRLGVVDLKTRWLINERSGVVHDTDHLTERCNTDQIPRRFRRATDVMPRLSAEPRLRFCHWCTGR